ncbi:MAG: hypothetical protein M3092_00750, partial [Actinomycetia bacterium]|nr:hypothetical protein [Actinomycetes bacterium]
MPSSPPELVETAFPPRRQWQIVKERRNPTNGDELDIMPVPDPAPSRQHRVQARDDRARSRELNSATWSG